MKHYRVDLVSGSNFAIDQEELTITVKFNREHFEKTREKGYASIVEFAFWNSRMYADSILDLYTNDPTDETKGQ